MILRPPPKLTNRKSVTDYIDVDLWAWLKQLSLGILSINFQENFQSFTVSNITIPAGQQVAIRNQFLQVYPGLIPSGRIITRQSGDANIIDGQTWTSSLLYLLNPSANDAVVSVLFFK